MPQTDTHPDQSLYRYKMCRSQAPAKLLFNKPHKRDTSESWARCSTVTPFMKPDSLRPPQIFQRLVCVWQLSLEITLGFHKSHPCVVESHLLFNSRAELHPVMRTQNPSLFTTPWQPLSDLVILHYSSVQLQTKLHVTPGICAVTAKSTFTCEK